jgi:hypothetical protein
MDTAWTWELSGYCAKYSFLTEPKGLTMREVERIFQLDPEPPVRGNLNDYILETVQSRDLRWFSFFLHHYENRLNGRVRRFLLREGLDRYDPERFLDYKMGCVLAMLDCLWEYDPAQGANFLTYAHHFIGNALLTCRMQEETGSFENVDEYKAVRGIAWLYNQSGQSEQAAIQKYAQKNGCAEETAAKFLALAKQNRSRVPFYQTIQDEDSEETGEDVSRDDHWDYAEILWNGSRAETVREAFKKLNYREQTLLEKRNAICMTCGRVSPISSRLTFEELAVLFEGSTASGAERAYRKAVEHLACLLEEAGALHMIRLKRKSQTKRKKKIAAAVYLYQVDNDGEWGEISFDFEAGTAEIIRLAEWDTMASKMFATKVVALILKNGDLQVKEFILPVSY